MSQLITHNNPLCPRNLDHLANSLQSLPYHMPPTSAFWTAWDPSLVALGWLHAALKINCRQYFRQWSQGRACKITKGVENSLHGSPWADPGAFSPTVQYLIGIGDELHSDASNSSLAFTWLTWDAMGCTHTVFVLGHVHEFERSSRDTF